jgi:hypothetical protein
LQFIFSFAALEGIWIPTIFICGIERKKKVEWENFPDGFGNPNFGN